MKQRVEATYDGHDNSSIIVPKLMHDPDTGDNAKEEEDEDDYEESNGEAEDGIPPVTLVAGHLCVLPPSGVE